MKYRRIGKTEMVPSCIGLGGNIFGYLLDRQETAYMVKSAYDLGINFVDTADVYSNGLSEDYIGSAIAGNRSNWIIATKAGITKNEAPYGLGSPKTIRSKLEGSLRRLKTEYIDLYQLHHFDPSTPVEESLSVLDELVQEGKIRSSGCSNYNSEQLTQTVFAAQNSGISGFSTIQTAYNILKREPAQSLIPVCIQNNIGIIVYGVLARGVLTNKYVRDTSKNSSYMTRSTMSKSIANDLTAEILELTEKLNHIAKVIFQSNLQSLSVSWSIHHNQVCSAVIGIRTIQQLTEMVNAVNLELDQKILDEIDKIVGDPSQYNHLSLGNFLN